MPWGTVFDNVLPAVAAARRAAWRLPWSMRPYAGRARGLRQSLSARIVGRHAHAGLDRPRARHASAAASDGRAFRGARRDRALPAQRRSAAAKEATGATVVFVTHSVYESVYLSTRIAVMAPRPGRIVAEIVNARPTRGFPRQRGLRGHLPTGLGGAASRDERDMISRGRRLGARSRRRARPLGGSGAPLRDPALCLPSPTLVLTTLISDRAILFPALMVTLGTTLEALAFAVIGGVAFAVLFSQSKWIERAFLPVAIVAAGDADHRHRAIAPHLSRCPRRRADLRLSRRLFPDPVEYGARPRLG